MFILNDFLKTAITLYIGEGIKGSHLYGQEYEKKLLHINMYIQLSHNEQVLT
jgi:hypothetical protein